MSRFFMPDIGIYTERFETMLTASGYERKKSGAWIVEAETYELMWNRIREIMNAEARDVGRQHFGYPITEKDKDFCIRCGQPVLAGHGYLTAIEKHGPLHFFKFDRCVV